MRLRHGWFAACVLAAGCGSISDNGNNIDAAVVADTTAPMLVSSSPASMAKNVGVLSRFTLLFDEPLDAATVSATTVKATYLPFNIAGPYLVTGDVYFASQDGIYQFGEQPIAGAVSYDDTLKKISFIPAQPLPRGLQITLTVTGVKDTAGNAFAGTPIIFATTVNSDAKRYTFNSITGVAGSWQDYGPDMNGRLDRRVLHNNAGPDGTWHTMDDNISSRYVIAQGEDGRLIDERIYSAGADAKLGTSDDVVSGYIKYTYDAMKRVTERYYASGTAGAGGDGMFGTADDVPVEVQTSTYDAMGRYKETVLFSDPGTDFAWRTADDFCFNFSEFQYDAEGRKTRDVIRSCGPDKIAKTVDDTIVQYKDYAYDAAGLVTDITTFYDKGLDSVFFTADDRAFARYSYDRASGAVATTINYYGAPGLDDRWKTADDVLSQVEKDTLDEHGLVTTRDFYNGGPDGVLGNADDLVSYYETTTYDANGNRLVNTQFQIGTDGMAHTADDRKSFDLYYDPSK